MGLDMFLGRVNKAVEKFITIKDFDVDTIVRNKDEYKEEYESIYPYIRKRGERYAWYSLEEEVGYWRKANHIHNWFVSNLADDSYCGEYKKVSKEKLEELKNVCEQVLSSIKLVTAKIKNGQTLRNGKWIDDYIDGEMVEDSSVAEKLLPCKSGFFFGSTEYDQWYVENIKKTIEIINEVLESTDFETESIYYSTSW